MLRVEVTVEVARRRSPRAPAMDGRRRMSLRHLRRQLRPQQLLPGIARVRRLQMHRRQLLSRPQPMGMCTARMRTAHRQEEVLMEAVEEEADPIQPPRPVSVRSVAVHGSRARSPPRGDAPREEPATEAAPLAEEEDQASVMRRRPLQPPIRQRVRFWICRQAMRCEPRNRARCTSSTYRRVCPRGTILAYPVTLTPST